MKRARKNATTTERKVRQCSLCKNHDIFSKSKGHKHCCPFEMCFCLNCSLARKRRSVMAAQVKLRRHQEAELDARKMKHRARPQKQPSATTIAQGMVTANELKQNVRLFLRLRNERHVLKTMCFHVFRFVT